MALSTPPQAGVKPQAQRRPIPPCRLQSPKPHPVKSPNEWSEDPADPASHAIRRNLGRRRPDPGPPPLRQTHPSRPKILPTRHTPPPLHPGHRHRPRLERPPLAHRWIQHPPGRSLDRLRRRRPSRTEPRLHPRGRPRHHRRRPSAPGRRPESAPPPDLITIRQCHTGIIQRVARADFPLTTPEGKALLRGDALYTRDPNLLLGILTADCVPVLVADTRTHAIAAFHAGWRGTLARIVERGIGTLRRDFGSRPQDLIAAIGPSIGACCFAIGEEVRHEFESQFAYAPELFSEVYDADPIRNKYPMLFLTARAPGHSNLGPQIHLDLWEANRRQLLDAGLRPSAITLINHCTACTRLPDGRRKYFSHRAEQGFTGRMLSLIGTTAP
jgi:YfiH family protein